MKLQNFVGVHVRAWPAQALALRPGITESCADSFLNQCALKFGHSADNLEHKPTESRAQVQVVTQAYKSDAGILEFRKSIHQMAKGTAKPVQFPDENRVEALPRASIISSFSAGRLSFEPETPRSDWTYAGRSCWPIRRR